MLELHLFLTSKVRLHCDEAYATAEERTRIPFPDLKGQAPLRPDALSSRAPETIRPFPDLKGQAPLRPPTPRLRCEPARPPFSGSSPLSVG